jgi:hypothetical protein
VLPKFIGLAIWFGTVAILLLIVVLAQMHVFGS